VVNRDSSRSVLRTGEVTRLFAFQNMILQALCFTKLGAPFDTPSGGSWDDQITYNYTTDPEFGNTDYVKHYTDL